MCWFEGTEKKVLFGRNQPKNVAEGHVNWFDKDMTYMLCYEARTTYYLKCETIIVLFDWLYYSAPVNTINWIGQLNILRKKYTSID